MLVVYTDMWGLSAVQSGTWNGSTGWYVPSRGEWAAFGAAFGITEDNYTNYGLSTTIGLLRSTVRTALGTLALARLYGLRQRHSNRYVRLGTTF